MIKKKCDKLSFIPDIIDIFYTNNSNEETNIPSSYNFALKHFAFAIVKV